MKKLKANQNQAKDVETPQVKAKRIDISDRSKAKIVSMNNQMNTYIAAIADEKGIEGPWTFDMRRMQIVVPER